MKSRRSFIILSRMFNDGLHNIVRNFWLTTAATAVMTVTLTILLFSGVANVTLRETIDQRTDDFALGVYFNQEVTEEEVGPLKTEINSREYVADVTYISSQQAKQIFIDQYRDEDFVNEGLALTGDNILPSSFDIRFNDLQYLDEVIALIESDSYTELIYSTSDTDIRRQSIDQYLSIQKSVNKATVVAAGVFAVISILIIFNTIRMAVFSRSKEIEIMKLIGATPSYIRGPFLVEASLYGFVAALIAFSAVYSAMLSILPGVSSLKSAETIKLFSDYWYAALGATVLLGLLIGLISSWLATAKYLRLKRW